MNNSQGAANLAFNAGYGLGNIVYVVMQPNNF